MKHSFSDLPYFRKISYPLGSKATAGQWRACATTNPWIERSKLRPESEIGDGSVTNCVEFEVIDEREADAFDHTDGERLDVVFVGRDSGRRLGTHVGATFCYSEVWRRNEENISLRCAHNGKGKSSLISSVTRFGKILSNLWQFLCYVSLLYLYSQAFGHTIDLFQKTTLI